MINKSFRSRSVVLFNRKYETKDCKMTNQYPGEMCEELQASLDIIAGKWKSSILFHLINNEKLCFSELQKAMSRITKKC